MKKCTLLLLLAGILSTGYSQSITAYPDTTICSADSVMLYAVVDGSYGTESYTYAEIPYAPEPIGGTVHNMVDDTHTGPFSIGFDFCFFGQVYTQFYIASNGWISFLTPTGGMDVNWTPDGPIPFGAGVTPKPAIFGPWTDWHSGLCTNCIFHEVVGVAPNRKLIVTYEDVPLFSCTAFEGTFQFVLHETTNVIENHLTHVDVCPTWDLGVAVQGIINEDGTEAFSVAGRNATDWFADDESWRWIPDAITWYETATGIVVGTGDNIYVNPDVTTTYTAEITLCDGTIATDEVTVTVSTPYEVTLDVQQIACFGATNAWIDVDVTGNTNPITYTWSTGSTIDSIYDLGAGTYTITIQEEDGCAWEEDVVITEPPLLTLDTVLTVDVTCFGGSDGVVNLNPGGGVLPYQFSFDGINWQTDSNFISLEAGTYTFTVRDAFGCTTSFTGVVISQPPQIMVDAGPDQSIAYGQSVVLLGTTGAPVVTAISWSPVDYLSCIDCLQPTCTPTFNSTYVLTVTDANGCQASDSVNIWVDIDFVVPNAFSPNDDGLNDVFNISTDLLISYDIRIYDRWGAEVFHSTDINFGWDGKLGGLPQEIGTYVYVIKSTTTLNTPITKSGTITLLR